ncbi:MAG: beta-lactamase family protein [Proteobacteria bacterium]|nr:beta-lactamase family protein [Pseudomonadota bacterium]
MTLATRLEKLPAHLNDYLEETKVPGVSMAVILGDETFEAAAGYVNLDARIEATTDSVFQIGSITKLFTTTLVMQLVDEEKVELDTPVKHYIPELQLADPEAAETVTLRHLLTHSSGIDGDYFEDTGTGDDCVERYILSCRALPQLHAPGQMLSYCNAGFIIAGRLVEKLRGGPWHKVLQEKIIGPLGLFRMGTEPEVALLNRVAVGHMPNPETGDPMLIPIWRLPQSNGPAGATPFAAARNLLAFARLYLDEGKTVDGNLVLSKESVRLVQEPQVDVPNNAFGFNGLSGWGLGWMLFDWDGRRVIGHDGGTIGQSSYFRMLPEKKMAVAVLTNGGDSGMLCRSIFDEVFGELAGISTPPPPEKNTDLQLDFGKYTGSYQRISTRIDIEISDDELAATTTGRRMPFNLLPPQQAKLAPVDPSLFLVHSPVSKLPGAVNFLDFDAEGYPRYIHFGGRASPRIS